MRHNSSEKKLWDSGMEGRTESAGFSRLAELLAEVGRSLHSRGWALGTSGNFSAVVSREPLLLAITGSGLDKGELTAEQILEVDADAKIVSVAQSPKVSTAGGNNARRAQEEDLTPARPSVETKLHLAVVRARDAGAVLHTHSVWSTILSEAHASRRGLTIEGYEMLKGLDGVRTHQHREWLPILENSQDIGALARAVETTLKQHPEAHGFLLRRHGLYTWGTDLAAAKRHVETLEFLMEVVGQLGFGRSSVEAGA